MLRIAMLLTAVSLAAAMIGCEQKPANTSGDASETNEPATLDMLGNGGGDETNAGGEQADAGANFNDAAEALAAELADAAAKELADATKKELEDATAKVDAAQADAATKTAEGKVDAGESAAGSTAESAAGELAKAAAATPGEKLTIAVIPKGTTHVYWKSVERGAKEAGEEFGAEIIWKGPIKENDRAQQIQVVQQFVSQQVDGIALAPLDLKALVAPVKAAQQADVPVVILDSALDGKPGEDFVSFVATDNRVGGQIAGEYLASLLPDGGNVVLLRYQVGSASTTNREAGFLDALSKHENIKVVSDNRYAGATAGEAKTQALNMIDQVRAADAVFCPNESSTMGMLLALQQEGLAGKIKFVGFDASPPLVKALENGEIAGLVVQNPRKMGYLSVKTLIQHLRGEAVEPVIDTGAVLVTLENLSDPKVKALIE